MQHYGICISVLEIYSKLDTLSWLARIVHWLWSYSTSPIKQL